jgi:hypothetical protein
MNIQAICKNTECESEINCDEIERRLNAAEYLSPDDVRYAVLAMMDGRLGFTKRADTVVDALYSYAETIESKGGG